MQSETLSTLFNTKSKTVNNAVITIGNTDDSGKGKHFKSRFIQPGLVKIEGHGIVLLKKETIDNSLKSMVGSPVIVKHQDVTNDNADELRCGVISDAYFNDEDGWYYAEGVIWSDKALKCVKKGWSVSCSYDFTEYDDAGGVENNIKYDKEFTKLNFTHLALVDNPRYERANIVFNCKVDNTTDKYGNKGHWIWQDGHPVFIEEGKSRQQSVFGRAKAMAENAPKEENSDPFSETGHSALLNDIMRRVGYSQVRFRRNKPADTETHYAYRAQLTRSLEKIYDEFLKGILDQQGRKSRWSDDGVDVLIPKSGGNSNSKAQNKDSKEGEQMIIEALKDFIDRVENAKDDNGRWITIKGTHVFIPDGKSVDEVMKEKGWDKSSKGYSGDEEGITGLVSKEKDVEELDKIHKERERREAVDKELYKKYERDDVDWDEEQLKKDLKAAQDLGYKEVEDIAEYLGLDEDEVRETLASDDFATDEEEGNKNKGEIKLQVSDEFKSKKHPEGLVFDLIGKDELIKAFEDAPKGKEIPDEVEEQLQAELKKIYGYHNLTKLEDMQWQLYDELEELRDQWKEAGGKRKEVGQKSNTKDNKTNNSKENDMAILEELKKLITKVENEKGEQDMDEKEKVDNEQIDKRKLIDEVGGMLKNKVDEEVWRTIIGKLEKIAYNGSEDSKTDNKKVKNEDEEDVKNKKVKNEDEEDKEKAEEVNEDVKEDVENKCKNSKSSFDKINEIYNSVKAVTESGEYVSRQDKLDAAVEYFS